LLYSNPGEIVFSPFAGIGSEGFVSLGGTSPKTKKQIYDTRRFYGCELKTEYHQQALKNLLLASRQHSAVHQTSLFAELEEVAP
jgi:DNA modification methylase